MPEAVVSWKRAVLNVMATILELRSLHAIH